MHNGRRHGLFRNTKNSSIVFQSTTLKQHIMPYINGFIDFIFSKYRQIYRQMFFASGYQAVYLAIWAN